MWRHWQHCSCSEAWRSYRDARARRLPVFGLGRLPGRLGLALHLPLALAVLGADTVVVTTAGWVGHWWSNGVQLQHAALAIAVTALAAQLGAWHLIGWGFG